MYLKKKRIIKYGVELNDKRTGSRAAGHMNQRLNGYRFGRTELRNARTE